MSSIATGQIKSLEFHDKYTPQSCPESNSHMAATLGAGAQDDETYQALAEYNAVTVGGTYDVSTLLQRLSFCFN
jgi:hypothetical protein